MTPSPLRAALYLRVSTVGQDPTNQAIELRGYCAARGWAATEYTDAGVSGATEKRPALDRLVADARRRKLDVVVVWSLDRLGRSLRHLIQLLDGFQTVGVGFISLREGLDGTTAAGRLQWQIIGAIAEFERARIAERVKAGLARARTQGKRLGRPRAFVPVERLQKASSGSIDDAARALSVSRSTIKRWRRLLRQAQETLSA
jgi:DNA invertase Pin-like site-specific DNA recombinase